MIECYSPPFSARKTDKPLFNPCMLIPEQILSIYPLNLAAKTQGFLNLTVCPLRLNPSK